MKNKLQSVMQYQTKFEVPEKDLFRDKELGLPEIHKVSGSQEKNKATSYVQEQAMQSLGLIDKINMTLNAFDITANDESPNGALAEMIQMVTSESRFDSPEEFAEYLTEGILFNVNRMISKAIDIPQGEYVVYSIGPKKAMLVPTTELSVQETDFTSLPRMFEIHTDQLLGCWDRAEKLLSERALPNQSSNDTNIDSDGDNDANSDGETSKRGKRHKIQNTRKGAYGNMKYARDNNFRSEREIHDLSLDDIVQRLGGGVDKSTVSRWGAADGTPSSRMPSGENIIKLAKIGIDPDTFINKVG